MKGLLSLLLISNLAAAQTIELSVITDWETVSYYGSVDETKAAINSVLEYSSNLFDNQLNISTKITFVDIPQTESDDTIANHTHAPSLLDSVFEYRIASTEHYSADATVLFTKRDIAVGGQDLAGYAKIKSICSANSIAIVELTDNGLDGQTLAHELAHVLGAVHDGDAPCEATSNRGYLMSSAIHTGTDNLSQCSIDTINTVVKSLAYCLFEDNTTPVITVQPPTTASSNGGGGGTGIIFLLTLLIARGFRGRTH